MELSNGEYDCSFIQDTISTSEQWLETTTNYLEFKTTFITTNSDKIDQFWNSILTSVPTIEASSIIIPSSTIVNNFSMTTDTNTDSETDDFSEMSSKIYITTESSKKESITSTDSTEEMEESTRISSKMENTTIVGKNIISPSYDTTEKPISATAPIINEYSTLSPFFTDHPTESRNNVEEVSSTSILEEATVTMSIESTSTNWDAVTISSADNITKSFDCMKTPCYNGGTCLNTSEGSRVSFTLF